MRIGKLTLVLAVALLSYQALCGMSCTVQACALTGQQAPHCPLHPPSKKSQVPPCSHQFVFTAISTPTPSSFSVHDLGAAASLGVPSLALSLIEVPLPAHGNTRLATSPSPPGLTSLSLTVLRV